ncbi:MAG: hypothetical protein AB1941_01565 [Gemmatimonadota bacterium]
MKTLLAAALAALMLQSPTKPDYSGKWQLDPARSRDLPAYYARIASHTLDVTQTETHLRVGVVIALRGAPQQDTIRFDYALDGSEVQTWSPIRTPQGRVEIPTTLRARMDDAGAVHITIDRQLQTPAGPRTVTGTEEWRLSDDGATLTVRRLDETPQGRIDTDMVFVRR